MKFWKKCIKLIERKHDEDEDANDNLIAYPPEGSSNLSVPTHSVVEGLPHWDRPRARSVMIESSSEQSCRQHPINKTSDEDIPIASADSMAPLLGGHT